MASALIENLSAASALATTDLFYVKQAGARGVKATGTQLLALVGTAYVPLAGGTMTGALTIASGTLTASAPALSITQTWNAVGTRFDGAVVNVTNTTSAAGSFIQTWQLAGVNKVAVNKTGGLEVYQLATDASNYERLTLTGVAGASVNITAETLGTGGDNLDIVLTPAGNGRVVIGNVGIYPSSGLVQVAQVDSSIYGSSLQLKAYTSEDVIFYEGSTVIGRFLAGGGLQLSERTAPSAPAENLVRIYAEDNGAGKTRLMALFATGAAQQIAIEP